MCCCVRSLKDLETLVGYGMSALAWLNETSSARAYLPCRSKAAGFGAEESIVREGGKDGGGVEERRLPSARDRKAGAEE